MPFRLASLSPALGAEVFGLDLCRGVEREEAVKLAEILELHGVLVFRNQTISDSDHVRLGRCFGGLAVFHQSDNWESAPPEIFRSSNLDTSGTILPPSDERSRMLKLNWLWHVDGSYREIPPKGALLRGIEIIHDGGNTIFANLHTAYEALPAAMKARLEGLWARHSFEYMVRTQDMPELDDQQAKTLGPVDHPLVRSLPDGRRSLYLSPPYMECIRGWGAVESKALFDELTDWATQERFIYTHRWQPNDLIAWNNAWTMHRVMPYDLSQQRRIVVGVVILGRDRIEPAETPASTDDV